MHKWQVLIKVRNPYYLIPSVLLIIYRYLLNNPELSSGRRVLDLGCGCGASAIAAKLSGAAHVVANDIDPSKIINVVKKKKK